MTYTWVQMGKAKISFKSDYLKMFWKKTLGYLHFDSKNSMFTELQYSL